MSSSCSPDIVEDGLAFYVDYGVKKCYSGGFSTPIDLAGISSPLVINGFGGYQGDAFTGAYLGGIYRTGRGAPDQTSSYIAGADIGLSSPLNINTGGLTLECTFKPTDFATSTYFGLENVLIAKGAFSTLNYLMQINSSQLSFCKRSDSEGLMYSDISATFEPNYVYHCALVVNTGGDEVSGYQNGVGIGSQTVSTTIPIKPKADGSDPFYFPAAGGTDDLINFQGIYFGARVYNRALTVDEINQNFSATKSRFGL